MVLGLRALASEFKPARVLGFKGLEFRGLGLFRALG